MIIEDKVKLRKKVKKVRGKEYEYYFINFSVKFTPFLIKFRELHNVMLLTENSKITIPKANLYIYSYQHKKNGEKVPQFTMTIPKDIAEELWKKGMRKLKVIVELPDLVVKS